jgi:hypothetical protein
MPVITRTPLALAMAVLLSQAFAVGQEPARRPDWDQRKAVKMVKDLIALEELGDFPWDKVPWEEDSVEAAALARAEQKPILVYFFLKKNVGPAAAPC